jgi:glycosyltransferase involved in cell wall biosynthesis
MNRFKPNEGTILMVGPMPAPGQYIGGIAVLLSQILRAWDLPYEVDFFNTEREKRDYNKTGKLSLSNILRWIRNTGGLLKVVCRQRPVLLHYHTSQRLALLKDLITVAILRLLTGCRVIGHVHWACYDTLFVGSSPRIRSFQARLLLRAFDGLILMSNNILEDLGQSLAPEARALLEKKSTVIYNFTTLPEMNGRNGRGTQPTTLFFIGDVGRRKGVFDLITAAHRLQSEGTSPFRLVLAGPFGDSAAERELRQKVDSEQLSDTVQFAGPVLGSAKDRWFRSADVFVLPSYGEGVPMSLLEAMSYALPAVTTRVGGIPEVVDDGSSGLLVRPGDPEALCGALRKLIESADLRIALGQHGRARVEKHHTPAHYLRALEAVYAAHCS